MIIKTTEEIFEDPWGVDKKDVVNPKRTPAKWSHTSQLTFEDVMLWEEIYFQPGAVGVYGAWQPYEDYYAIFHLMHRDVKYVEIFSGRESIDVLLERCKTFGVILPSKDVFVNN
jgi:hypothetical protein